MIVIVGDSWGCGEYNLNTITHGGLAQYLAEDGQNVINLSVGGSSNWEIYERLKLFFDSGIPNYIVKKIKMILVFQTEWTRDFSIKRSTCVDSRVGVDAISCWQYRLSEVAVKHNIEIGLIGGCSDTMYLDQFKKEYSGLFIACQSVTNLCVNNNHRIDNPTFFCRPGDELLLTLNDHYQKYSSINNLVSDLDKGLIRMDIWKNNKEWFFPDGNHINRAGHKKLHNFLKDNNIV